LIINAPPEARLLVDAPPGTGKTEIAARRLGALVNGKVSPGQILVLSFSRSAVRTLTRRLTKLSDADTVEELRHLAIRTFDSWAFRILRLAGCRTEELLSRRYEDNIEMLTGLISGGLREEIRQVIGAKKCILVDEFQDLPGVRGDLVLALLDLLAPPGQSGAGFTVLGDPAQAIFGFAGRVEAAGTPLPTPREYWQRLLARYGDDLKPLTLTQNFRATPAIAKISDEMRTILSSDAPEAEKLAAIRAKLETLPPSEALTPAMLAPREGSRAILTRTNGEAVRVLKELFGDDVIGGQTPVRLRAAGHAVVPPAWIAAFLRELKSPQLLRTQFVRIHEHLGKKWNASGARPDLYLPPVDAAWSRLVRASGGNNDDSIDLAELRTRLFWPDSFPDDQQTPDDGIVVTTIHQSKGMEFDLVTLLESEQKAALDDAAAIEEEASVAYVAATRAAQALTRLPSDSIWPAPLYRDFAEQRQRLCHWWNGWVNLEMGIPGDIDPTGFADPALHGGETEVQNLQKFFLENVRALEGHKVMLVKAGEARGTHYNIHLQNDREPGRLIGRTTKQITWDLLRLLHEKGYYLPGRIMNLRISAVGTYTGPNDGNLGDPERTSRLWLGVGLCGTGDFKPWKLKWKQG
jgi:DNA helicase-2/ATP-dependent DNA helicase PcrA